MRWLRAARSTVCGRTSAAQLRGEIAALRGEMRTGFAEVLGEIAELRGEMSALRSAFEAHVAQHA
ncbi:MAG: hypothetical protein H0V05_19055 [Euzebyaceae bacterium]|nr:hypothetical protein [Euzebyaceae bacterium]